MLITKSGSELLPRNSIFSKEWRHSYGYWQMENYWPTWRETIKIWIILLIIVWVVGFVRILIISLEDAIKLSRFGRTCNFNLTINPNNLMNGSRRTYKEFKESSLAFLVVHLEMAVQGYVWIGLPDPQLSSRNYWQIFDRLDCCFLDDDGKECWNSEISGMDPSLAWLFQV